MTCKPIYEILRARCTTCGSILFDGQIQYCDEICWMEDEE